MNYRVGLGPLYQALKRDNCFLCLEERQLLPLRVVVLFHKRVLYHACGGVEFCRQRDARQP